MGWSYNGYILSNFGITFGIIVVTTAVLAFIIYKYNRIFYKIVKLMFYIELKEIPKDDVITTTPVQAFAEPSSTNTVVTITPKAPPKKLLDLYGKIIDGDKRRHTVSLAIIIVAVFSTSCLAFVQGCILVNVLVYFNEPCPNYGPMDCYAADTNDNNVYFTCYSGLQTTSVQFNQSATCFRWIVRDMSISDALTQVGSCVGLLHALCAIVQLAFRFLLYAWSKHLQTPELTEEEKKKNPINKPNFIYEHPFLFICTGVTTPFLCLLALVGAVLLGFYKISVTGLTYMIIFVVIIIITTAFMWMTDDEAEELERILEHKPEFDQVVKKQSPGQIIKTIETEDVSTVFNNMVPKR